MTRFHRYTLDALLKTECGGHGDCIGSMTYDELFASDSLSGGTYVFSDIERLSNHERLLASAIFREMATRPEIFRLINDPARVRTRYSLLRALREAGLNRFDAYRADGQPHPRRFPVFLKAEAHHGPALSGLIFTQAALDAALEDVEAGGTPLDGLVVIEFAAAPSHQGVWTRHTGFRIGDEILIDMPVTESHWMVKNGEIGLVGDETYGAHDRIVRENHYDDSLMRAFEVARIGFGRCDFGIVDGRAEIYEINTNPCFYSALPPHPSAVRQATLEFTFARLTERLARLAEGGAPDAAMALDIPLVRHFREASGGAPMSWRP